MRVFFAEIAFGYSGYLEDLARCGGCRCQSKDDAQAYDDLLGLQWIGGLPIVEASAAPGTLALARRKSRL